MKKSFRSTIIAAVTCAAIFAAGLAVSSQRMRADDRDERGDDNEQSKIKIGAAIAPVPLKLKGKNRELAYLGSDIVNARGDCKGCKTSDQRDEADGGGGPDYGQQQKKVDTTRYMRGGNR